MSDSHTWSVLEARTALRARRLSAREYAEDLIARTRALAALGAYITPTPEFATRAPNPGPLQGIPLAIKDNIDIAGVRTTAATPRLREHIPTADSAAWRLLAAAGAVLLGKTSMHELAYGATGACTAAPTARNPVAPTHLAGGSSSGTAAAVAAGLAPAGLGTDTGGSVRIPAAVCGIIGFRPSTGRYPESGVLHLSPTRDAIGVMARTVPDILLLDAVLTGRKPSTPRGSGPQRLAIPQEGWRDLHPEVHRLATRALDALERAGHQLIPVDESVHGGSLDELLPLAMWVSLAETPAAFRAYLADSTATFEEVIASIASPDVREILTPLLEFPIPEQQYRADLKTQARLRETAAAARTEFAATVMPTTVLPAVPVGSGTHLVHNGVEAPTFPTFLRHTGPAAILGLPSITLPIGATRDGLPVGLQFDGHPQRDIDLLHLAECLSAVINPDRRAPD
ncbi:amidase family protein [Nocardia panacis]|nr:amidase family protein [Nocardia panacis]